MRAACLSGFTLAELLISLAILGMIATFTIPKILTSSQNSQFSAEANETAGMISAAYRQAFALGLIGTGTKPSDLTSYMNYVKVDTTSEIDQEYSSPWGAGQYCDANNKCLVLHNGAKLLIWDDGGDFGGSNPTNAIYFDFDPDGKVTDGTTDGPGKSVEFILYYNGRITTHYQMDPNTANSNGPRGTDGLPGNPPWLTW
jgi:prepilin-type N-terminal cleavage/methylation domain-containing protein